MKYYKIKVFPFSDVMEENIKKQITFFFLSQLWRRINITGNLTLVTFKGTLFSNFTLISDFAL